MDSFTYSTNYKDALKYGFYELQNARDWYREVTSTVRMHADLVKYWIWVLAILSHPLRRILRNCTPSSCNHLHPSNLHGGQLPRTQWTKRSSRLLHTCGQRSSRVAMPKHRCRRRWPSPRQAGGLLIRSWWIAWEFMLRLRSRTGRMLACRSSRKHTMCRVIKSTILRSKIYWLRRGYPSIFQSFPNSQTMSCSSRHGINRYGMSHNFYRPFTFCHFTGNINHWHLSTLLRPTI